LMLSTFFRIWIEQQILKFDRFLLALFPLMHKLTLGNLWLASKFCIASELLVIAVHRCTQHFIGRCAIWIFEISHVNIDDGLRIIFAIRCNGLWTLNGFCTREFVQLKQMWCFSLIHSCIWLVLSSVFSYIHLRATFFKLLI
jgi:hypothetical protein